MLARRGSSCRALHVLFRALRLPTCPGLVPTRPCGRSDPRRSAFPGVSCPLRDVSQRHPHTREIPIPRFGPSSAFRTPSTVFATTGLAGLFHPAATSRVHPSGVSPPPGARPAFANRLALVPLCIALRGFDPVRDALGCRALLPGWMRWSPTTVRPPGLRSPPGLAPPPGVPTAHRAPNPGLSAGPDTSACDLRCDEPAAADPWRLAGARSGWRDGPFRDPTLPTRSRFST
jgi:hypothetical protein